MNPPHCQSQRAEQVFDAPSSTCGTEAGRAKLGTGVAWQGLLMPVVLSLDLQRFAKSINVGFVSYVMVVQSSMC